MGEREPLCPFCGAYSPRRCELEEETGGVCPWQEIMDDEEEDFATPSPAGGRAER